MANIKESTKEIIKHLEEGKLTQTEITALGYPFGTVRYWYQKMYQPKKFERFMNRHKRKAKQKRVAEKKELSTTEA